MAGGRVDEVPDNVFAVGSRINSTWGGNLTDMVRARRILEVIESDGADPARGRARPAPAADAPRAGRRHAGGQRRPRSRADVRVLPGRRGARDGSLARLRDGRARAPARLRHPQHPVPPGAHRSPRTWRRASRPSTGCWRGSLGTRGRPPPSPPGARDPDPPQKQLASSRPGRRAAARSVPGTAPGAGERIVVGAVTGKPSVDAVPFASAADVEAAITRAHAAFLAWRERTRAGARPPGQAARRLLTEHKEDWPTSSASRSARSARRPGEVQEMIDICDFAVGLSRQLDGRTMPSERPGHRLMETWHPLGVVGVVSAFNFPAAVWSWNAALALVCGDAVVWKPSEKTALVAVARALAARAAREVGAPRPQRPSVSPTPPAPSPARQPPGSADQRDRFRADGCQIAPRVAARFGRDPGARRQQRRRRHAVGGPRPRRTWHRLRGRRTAGQRCTTLRRLIVHESLVETRWSKTTGVHQRLVHDQPPQRGARLPSLARGPRKTMPARRGRGPPTA